MTAKEVYLSTKKSIGTSICYMGNWGMLKSTYLTWHQGWELLHEKMECQEHPDAVRAMIIRVEDDIEQWWKSLSYHERMELTDVPDWLKEIE